MKVNKHIYFFLLLLGAAIFTPGLVSGQCITDYNFSWDNGSGVGNTWAASDVSKSYTNVGGSGVNITLTLTDLDNQNCDIGNPSGFGDYTETTGGFGNDVLTYQMTSTTSSQLVTFTFTFSEAIRLADFTIFDIDYNGSGTNLETFQDEMTFSAKDGVTNVPITLTQHSSATGSIVSISGQSAKAAYQAGVSGNVGHTDVNGAVVVSTTLPITELIVSYSNGPEDEGESDDHAVSFPGFVFCKAPADSDSDGIIDFEDIDDDNDGILDEIEACGSLGGGNVDIDVEIKLDNFPGETSWTLTASGGGSIGSGSGYSTNGQLIQQTYSVAPGDYVFTINDTYGDGLTSTGGYYQITVDGSVVVGPISTTFTSNSHNLTAGSAAFSCISGDPSADADSDGTLNYQDADFCTLNSNGVCTSLDTDGDGIIDQFDLDSDGDGCYDAEEAGHGEAMETDNTIVASASEVGSNGMDAQVETNDTLTANINYTLTETNSGTFDFQSSGVSSACAVVTDTDGDGVADTDDLDDDNDGIPDVLEKRCDQSGVANSKSGSGIFQDQLYFFNWSNAVFGDGIQENDSETFNLPDGLTITITFSNVVNGTTYVPTDMLTWGGAYLHQLYNNTAAGTNEALYGADGVDASFTVTFAATKNGLPFSLDLLALDSESTYPGNETLSFTTNAGNWTALETFGGGGVWTGANTTTIQAINTETSGGNTIFYSEGATVIDIAINAGGREGVAFGIFLVCDADQDGIPNHLDLDADNDGIPDIVEAGGIDTNGDGHVDYPTPGDPTSMVDVDNDGLADALDNQNSGDASEVTSGTPLSNRDSDGDGINDFEDLDADNDGIPDIVEAGGIDTNGDGRVDTTTDVDLDGLADIYDEVATDGPGPDGSNGTALVETDGSGNMLDGSGNTVDADGDGLADHIDLDADNDGIPDVVEAGGIDTNGDGHVDTNTDSDQDGLADIYDEAASDGSGIDGVNGTALIETDGSGNMLDGAGNSVDADGDGYADHIDLDADNDGIPDLVEAGGIDTNGDGRVDTNTDADQDGLADIYDEIATDGPGPDGSNGTALVETDGSGNMLDGSGNSVDADGDGLADHIDLDADNDGIPDIVEAGGIDTNGDGRVDTNTDTDQDGLADIYDEAATDGPGPDGSNGTALVETDGSGNMLDGAGNSIDSDLDGLADHIDLDADNDGIPDVVEVGGIDINGDGQVDANTDVDNDGLADIYDEAASDGPDGTGTNGTALVETDGAGNLVDGVAGMDLDTDGDNIPDHLDLDADNDGIPDLIEAGGIDPEGDGMVDTGALPWDADNDGLYDGYDSDNNNIVGIGDGGTALIITSVDDGDGRVDGSERMLSGGTNNVNADGDTAPNHLDLDADNDGIVDVVEAGGTDTDGNGQADGATGSNGYNNALDPADTGNPLMTVNTDTGDSNTRPEYTDGNVGIGDTDSDDVPNFLDVDADNDGIYDNYEAQSTAGYTPPGSSDSDGDGLLDAYDNSVGFGGTGIDTNGGTTAADNFDLDSDNTPDYLDSDSDDDNIPDRQEAWDHLGDGDSKPDNSVDCTTGDADGDGLLDCFDANDASLTSIGWENTPPADDGTGTDGATNSTGTPFTSGSTLDEMLPNNGGVVGGEPDFRDVFDCSNSIVYYAVTEQGDASTEYEYNSVSTLHEDGAGTQIVRATAYCEPDADGWYYYYNPLEPTNYLFAIQYNNSPAPVIPLWELVDYIEIKVEATPSARVVTGASSATIVMERDWHVVFKGTATSGSTFNVKFYFRPEEMAALDAAADDIEANATSPVRSALQWFKKPSGLSNGDISETGVASMTDITAMDASTINETNSGNTDGSAATSGNGRNYVSFTGLSSFSGGTAMINIAYSALPVELNGFDVKEKNCKAELNWQTASEDNFSHFEIEKSTNGSDFQTIQTIYSNGNSAGSSYTYLDDKIRPIAYYRLKMMDFDGSIEYSSIVVLEANCELSKSMVIYPNPLEKGGNQLQIEFYSSEKVARFEFTDLIGKQVMISEVGAEIGRNVLRFDISTLPIGTYFIRNTIDGRGVAQKLIIVDRK